MEEYVSPVVISEKDLALIATSFLLVDWLHPDDDDTVGDRSGLATFIVDRMQMGGYNYATIKEVCKMYNVPFDYIGDDLEVDKEAVELLSSEDKLMEHVDRYLDYMGYWDMT